MYYLLQGIAGSAAAWDACYSRLQEYLPICFRLTLRTPTLSPSVAAQVTQALLRGLGARAEPAAYHSLEEGSVAADFPACSLWTLLAGADEGGSGLEACQDVGLLQRQEQNSALPGLLLGVKAHHAVIDLCAAPGSKSLHVLDLMLADAVATHGPGALPSGLLVANDVARDRVTLLAKRMRRQLKHCVLVTNSDGRHYPTVRRRRGFKFRFDRAVCDVPCSGDGTLRKDRSMRGGHSSLWAAWSARKGLNLHALQMRCLKRGLQMLGPGGRLIYSTCSLNPIEDEAVVAGVLSDPWGDGSCRLVPFPAIPGFTYQPGLDTWKVPDPAFSAEKPSLYASLEEARLARGDKPGRGPLLGTMFPPAREDVRAQLHLCGRVLPTHSDGGGFFLALFERQGSKSPKALLPTCSAEGEGEEGDDQHSGAEEGEECLQSADGLQACGTESLAHGSDGEYDAEQVGVDSAEGKAEEEEAAPCSLAPLVVGAPESAEGVDADVRVAAPALQRLLRYAPADVVGVLAAEFGLQHTAEVAFDGAGLLPSIKLGAIGSSSLFVRGDSLVLASEQLAKIFCTLKGLQVVEAGHYLCSGIRGPFAEWRFYPEAANILGPTACRRVLCLRNGELTRLLSAGPSGVGLDELSEESEVPEGLVLLALRADAAPPLRGLLGPLGPLSRSSVVAYVLGRCSSVSAASAASASSAGAPARRVVYLPPESEMTARQWAVLLEGRGRTPA